MRTPLLLVVDDEPANRLWVAKILAEQWKVVEAADGDEAVAAVQTTRPDLIIMDIDMPRSDGWAATHTIRALGAPLSSVPILAYTTSRLDDPQVLARGMDGTLPKPCAPDVLVAAVAKWRPDGELAGVQRLAAVFGRDEMNRLVIRFHKQLLTALASLDDGGGDDVAHRIAGVAGTLGFPEVSRSWLRFSEGDETARDEARRDARLAIAAIEREWGAPPAA